MASTKPLLSLFCVTFGNAKSVTQPSIDTQVTDLAQKKQDALIQEVKQSQTPFNGLSTKDQTSSKNTGPKLNKSFKLPPREFLNTQQSIRKNKMIDYFAYIGTPDQAPDPVISPYHTPEYYNQQGYYGAMHPMEADDYMSRANRRRPSGNENSPIYYIRLPPTPYMFVPGMGYISQPPTIQPLAPQYSLPAPVPVNPFVNVPIDFLSNGKPTNVNYWPGASPSFGPQYPSYLPARPTHRPGYRPKPYLHDSKITHLKGPYIFNGRPEDVYVLPNDPFQQSPYRPHYSSNFNSHPYSNQMYNTAYNSGFNPAYSDPMQNFY
ncbi:hypothetical protein Bhyg_09737 [Pseudolycoriella hygida]|uniref:Uncharacterized protein n=1 Tax=Pseudolycoriella hygida TaxID=35572 RepID=A0A9Q0MS72_9DIPT|nr:hypothetical protein Bhyg_09737 [Pseudolycoriella hygida]